MKLKDLMAEIGLDARLKLTIQNKEDESNSRYGTDFKDLLDFSSDQNEKEIILNLEVGAHFYDEKITAIRIFLKSNFKNHNEANENLFHLLTRGL